MFGSNYSCADDKLKGRGYISWRDIKGRGRGYQEFKISFERQRKGWCVHSVVDYCHRESKDLWEFPAVATPPKRQTLVIFLETGYKDIRTKDVNFFQRQICMSIISHPPLFIFNDKISPKKSGFLAPKMSMIVHANILRLPSNSKKNSRAHSVSGGACSETVLTQAIQVN